MAGVLMAVRLDTAILVAVMVATAVGHCYRPRTASWKRGVRSEYMTLNGSGMLCEGSCLDTPVVPGQSCLGWPQRDQPNGLDSETCYRK